MLDITKVKAISLDLDDTLWPVWPTIERAEKALHQWLVEYAPMAAALFSSPPRCGKSAITWHRAGPT